MREVPFVRKADNLALATSHLAQSSSASGFTAGCFGFLLLIHCRERPELATQGEVPIGLPPAGAPEISRLVCAGGWAGSNALRRPPGARGTLREHGDHSNLPTPVSHNRH